jgi:transposase-like protein
MRYYYNPATVAKVQERLRAGEPAARIAKDMNLSLPTVYRWRNPDTPKPPKVSPEDQAAAVRRLVAGERAETLATELGVSTQTVRNWRKHATRTSLARIAKALSKVATRPDVPSTVAANLTTIAVALEAIV